MWGWDLQPDGRTAGGIAVLDPPVAARGRLALFALGAAPLVIIFVIVAVLLQADGISFTEPLNIVGTLTLPLLGGVFPMLLLVAARRRGERLPAG